MLLVLHVCTTWSCIKYFPEDLWKKEGTSEGKNHVKQPSEWLERQPVENTSHTAQETPDEPQGEASGDHTKEKSMERMSVVNTWQTQT